jgi:outer membrane protein OmpA-like peptidoglycan-associated protein
MSLKIRNVFLFSSILTFSAFSFIACTTTQKPKKSPQQYIKKYMDKEALEIQQSVPNSKVERVGDSIKITFTEKVFFDHNMYELKPEAETAVKKMVQVLKKYSKSYNVIQGHTDNTGLEPYNLALSDRRAESVKTYLIKNGLAETRFLAHGVGSTQPVADNNTEHGRALNRRVVIWIAADFVLKNEAHEKTTAKQM